MKHYFIATHAAWKTFPKENFEESHWIETDDPTKILVVAKFSHHPGHDLWAGQEGVEPMPHLTLGGDPVDQKHISILSKIGAKNGDKTLDVATKAAAQHPAFRPDRD